MSRRCTGTRTTLSDRPPQSRTTTARSIKHTMQMSSFRHLTRVYHWIISPWTRLSAVLKRPARARWPTTDNRSVSRWCICSEQISRNLMMTTTTTTTQSKGLSRVKTVGPHKSRSDQSKKKNEEKDLLHNKDESNRSEATETATAVIIFLMIIFVEAAAAAAGAKRKTEKRAVAVSCGRFDAQSSMADLDGQKLKVFLTRQQGGDDDDDDDQGGEGEKEDDEGEGETARGARGGSFFVSHLSMGGTWKPKRSAAIVPATRHARHIHVDSCSSGPVYEQHRRYDSVKPAVKRPIERNKSWKSLFGRARGELAIGSRRHSRSLNAIPKQQHGKQRPQSMISFRATAAAPSSIWPTAAAWNSHASPCAGLP